MSSEFSQIKDIEKETNICCGFACNNNCIFCCEGHNRTVRPKGTMQIISELVKSRKAGSSRAIFMGGEPTIRKDLPALIKAAKKIGYEEIFIITNGRMLSSAKYCKILANAGLTHVLFSLNSSKPDIHDTLTRVDGSFGQCIRGIKNMKNFAVCIENNTVINKLNFKDLPKIAHLLVELKVDFFEFIFINPCGSALSNFDKVVPRYAEVMPYLKKALDIGYNAGIRVTAESLPFCLMEGYEKFMTELYMAKVREKVMPQQKIDNINESRKKTVKIKPKACNSCKYSLVCEGIWKKYAEVFGFGELSPKKGKKILSLEELREKFEY